MVEGAKIQTNAQENIVNEIVTENFPNEGENVTVQAHQVGKYKLRQIQ